MRCVSSLWALALALSLAACKCDGERRNTAEGAAKPLPFEVRSAGPPSSAVARVGCAPGKHRCVGENLEMCDPSAGGWTRVNVCQTAAHCNGKLQQCLVDPCVLGEWQCNGADLEQCHGNGWERVQSCASASACDEAAGACK
jgi:hypothetical protein